MSYDALFFYSYAPYVGSARAQRARGRNLAPSASQMLGEVAFESWDHALSIRAQKRRI